MAEQARQEVGEVTTMVSNGNGRSELTTWLRFVISIVALVLSLAGGGAVIYSRLCVVESKVEHVLMRIDRLEELLRDQKSTAQNNVAVRAR